MRFVYFFNPRILYSRNFFVSLTNSKLRHFWRLGGQQAATCGSTVTVSEKSLSNSCSAPPKTYVLICHMPHLGSIIKKLAQAHPPKLPVIWGRVPKSSRYRKNDKERPLLFFYSKNNLFYNFFLIFNQAKDTAFAADFCGPAAAGCGRC